MFAFRKIIMVSSSNAAAYWYQTLFSTLGLAGEVQHFPEPARALTYLLEDATVRNQDQRPDWLVSCLSNPFHNETDLLLSLYQLKNHFRLPVAFTLIGGLRPADLNGQHRGAQLYLESNNFGLPVFLNQFPDGQDLRLIVTRSGQILA